MAKSDKSDRKRKREDDAAAPAVDADAPAVAAAAAAAAVEEEPGVAEEKVQAKSKKAKEDKPKSSSAADDKKEKKKKKARKSEADDSGADASAAADPTTDAEDGDAAATDGGAEGEDEVEVISHKERRKRRRLEKQAAKNPAADGADDQQSPAQARRGTTVVTTTPASAANKPAPRSEHAVWIGNLAFSTTPQRLQTWLEDKCVGKIPRINMPKGARRHEYNKGFAYVDMPDETTLKHCISLSEQPLDGRRLLIKDAKDFRGRPALSLSSDAFSPSPATDSTAAGGAQSGGTDASATATATAAGPVPKLPPGAELLQRSANAALGKFAQSTLRAQRNAPSRTLFVGNLPFAATADGLRDIIEVAEQRKVDSERERLEAMELREVRRRRMEEKEKRREAAALAKKEGRSVVGASTSIVKKVKSESRGDDDDDDDHDGDSDSGDSSKSDDDSDGDDDDDDEKDGGDQTKDAASHTPKGKAGAAHKSSIAAALDDFSPAELVGLTKVRLATFEDNPEKCKGFAFLDFASTLHATRALINPRNRYYLARKLVFEYAGEEAQKRSGGQRAKLAAAAAASAAAAGGATGGDELEPRSHTFGGSNKRMGSRQPGLAERRLKEEEVEADGGDGDGDVDMAADASAPAGAPPSSSGKPGSKPSQAERAAARLARGRGRAEDRKLVRGGSAGSGAPGKRLKPGAALANAARGKVSIVASEGKKITFD